MAVKFDFVTVPRKNSGMSYLKETPRWSVFVAGINREQINSDSLYHSARNRERLFSLFLLLSFSLPFSFTPFVSPFVVSVLKERQNESGLPPFVSSRVSVK